MLTCDRHCKLSLIFLIPNSMLITTHDLIKPLRPPAQDHCINVEVIMTIISIEAKVNKAWTTPSDSGGPPLEKTGVPRTLIPGWWSQADPPTWIRAMLSTPQMAYLFLIFMNPLSSFLASRSSHRLARRRFHPETQNWVQNRNCPQAWVTNCNPTELCSKEGEPHGTKNMRTLCCWRSLLPRGAFWISELPLPAELSWAWPLPLH